MTHIAVTGAGGFIGRHLLAALNAHNDIDVTAIIRPGGNKNIFSHDIHLLEIDIQQAHDNAFEQMGCPDVVIHLAWQGLSDYRALHHFESEVPMQYQFLKSLIQQGLKNLLVTGTCLEYGLQSGALSTDLPTLPVTAYGFAKDMLRKQLEYLQSVYPYHLTWARLFYMYGDKQAESSLLSQLRKSVENQEKKFNMSGGEQLRDYLPVEHVVEQLVSLALRKENIGIINVCSGKAVSIRRLVEQWIKENNWNIEMELGYYPYPDYEPLAFWGEREIKKE